MIDLLIAVVHWCASCAPAGTGVPTALGAFGGAAGAAGGMGGMGGVASGGPGSSGDGNSGTDESTSDGPPVCEPGSSSSTSSDGSSAAAAAAAQAAQAAAASAASAANIARNDAIEADPVGQAIPGLFVGGVLSAGEGLATSLTAGGIEGAGTVTGEGAMTAGEETGTFEAIGDGAKAVGSFFASPFNPSANNPDPGDAGLGGPDATLPDAGQGNTTTPYGPPAPPPYNPGPPPPTPPEQTGLLDPVIDGAKVVGSFFASPFNPSANNPDLGDAGLGGPDATVPDAGTSTKAPDASTPTEPAPTESECQNVTLAPDPGHAGTTDPDAGAPSK